MQNVFFRLNSSASWQFRLTLVVGITAIVVVIGPFGTFEGMTFSIRMIYWFFMIGLADLVVFLAHRMTDTRFVGYDRLVRIFLRGIFFVALYVPVTWLWSSLFETDLFNLRGFGFFVLNVSAVTTVLSILAIFICFDEVDFTGARPLLRDRLVNSTSADIIRLGVDDHFVEVFLDDGTMHRLRMRLSDAVREMNGAPGFCTHRSHWVSQRHIAKRMVEQGREFVLMTDGTKVPVSKTYRENVVAAGLA